ncbi:hypothetical protein [Burkholderia pseudomultivorans]|uniref:hypothetical protein n=1 Tax=Burkholderia pseudomultivorans TaxID=1207504 RepID=UPI0022AB2764|nr:hypothetical protein [Burkholderia pseudomultivorans]
MERDSQGIEEHHRIHRLERSLLPLARFTITASGAVLIKSGDTLMPYISGRKP